jgi:hypothetical protein
MAGPNAAVRRDGADEFLKAPAEHDPRGDPHRDEVLKPIDSIRSRDRPVRADA